MAQLRDRVQCLVATTGTASTVTLGAATTGYRAFQDAYGATTANVSYVLADGAAWEVGTGTFDRTAGTFDRTTVDASSSGGTRIALTGSATLSVTFSSREHVPDWPLLIVSRDAGSSGGQFQVTNASTFDTVRINTVEVDTHLGWDNASYQYVVPQTGVYDIDGKVRFDDTTGAGASYGVGMDIANQDSAGFQWQNTINKRQGGFNTRTMALSAGQRVRLFVYCDAFQGPVNKAYLRIARVR